MISCKNCSVEVPPTWVHVININTCPACGSTLLNENELVLLEEIRDAFKRMPNNPEGLAGWILSNYSLTKIGEAMPVQFPQARTRTWVATDAVSSSGATSQGGPQEGETTFSDVETPTSPGEGVRRPLDSNMFKGMLKRAGVKPQDDSRLKSMVETIKKGGGVAATVNLDEDGDFEQTDDGDLFGGEDPQSEAMINALASGGKVDAKAILSANKLANARQEMRTTGSTGFIRRGS